MIIGDKIIGRRGAQWRPGRDLRAVRHAGASGASRLTGRSKPVVVAGGGIAGIAAAVGLAERGVPVIMIEPHEQLGGRVRSWPVAHGDAHVTMSRGFHAFFRQYYNLRALLRRVDPDLQSLVPLADYPLISADGGADSFATIPRTPPFNIAAFVLRSPSFQLRDLGAVNVPAALELLDVEFPTTFTHAIMNGPVYRVSLASNTNYYLKAYVGSYSLAVPLIRGGWTIRRIR